MCGPARRPHFSLAIISVTVQFFIELSIFSESWIFFVVTVLSEVILIHAHKIQKELRKTVNNTATVSSIHLSKTQRDASTTVVIAIYSCSDSWSFYG
jgi:hypothetical protein